MGGDVRDVREADYDKGFMELLAQLTAAGDVDRRAFNGMATRGPGAGAAGGRLRALRGRRA